MSRSRRPFRVVRNNPGPQRPPMPAQPAPSYDEQRLGVSKQFTQAAQELLQLARAAHGLDEELTKTQDAIRASRIATSTANPNLERLAVALGNAFEAVVEQHDALLQIVVAAQIQAEAALANLAQQEADARAPIEAVEEDAAEIDLTDADAEFDAAEEAAE